MMSATSRLTVFFAGVLTMVLMAGCSGATKPAVTTPAAPSGSTGTTAPAAKPATKIKLGSYATQNQTLAFFAKDKGLFEKHGLDVEITLLQGGPAVAAALSSGAVDVGCSNVFSIVQGYTKGTGYQILAEDGMHVDTGPTTVLLAKKGGPVQKAKDFEGKVIAVNQFGNTIHIATQKWLKDQGADLTKIKFIELGGAEANGALEQDKVHGILVGEPTWSNNIDKVTLVGSPYDSISKRFLISAYFTSKKWADANPEAAKAFQAAIEEAAKWGNANHKEAAEIYSKWSEQKIANPDKWHFATWGEKLATADIQPTIDISVEYGALAKKVPAAEVIWSGLGVK